MGRDPKKKRPGGKKNSSQKREGFLRHPKTEVIVCCEGETEET